MHPVLFSVVLIVGNVCVTSAEYAGAPKQDHRVSNVQPQLPAAVRESIAFDDSVKSRMKGGTDEERILKAWVIVNDALHRRELGLPRFEQMMHDAAWVMIESNAETQAITVFEKLEAIAAQPSWVWYAQTQLSRLLVSKDTKRAVEAARRAKSSITAAAVPNTDGDYQRAVELLSEALSASGDIAAAVSERAALLASERSASMDADDRLTLLRSNAIDLWRLGRHKEGQQGLLGFYADHPAHDLVSGAQQHALLWAAWADRDLGKVKDDTTLALMRSIWNNPAYAAQPETMHCASNLGTVLSNRRERAEQSKVLEEAIARFVTHETAWHAIPAPEFPDPDRFQNAAELYVQLTYELMVNYSSERRWDDMIRVGVDALKRVPKAEAAPRVSEKLDEARTALQKPTPPPAKR